MNNNTLNISKLETTNKWNQINNIPLSRHIDSNIHTTTTTSSSQNLFSIIYIFILILIVLFIIVCIYLLYVYMTKDENVSLKDSVFIHLNKIPGWYKSNQKENSIDISNNNNNNINNQNYELYKKYDDYNTNSTSSTNSTNNKDLNIEERIEKDIDTTLNKFTYIDMNKDKNNGNENEKNDKDANIYEVLNKAKKEQENLPSSPETNKIGYCYIGSDNSVRTCAKVGLGDVCMSGDIFPSRDICINPSLRP